ncbi:MAG: hypothetical protein WAO74_00490 [Polaribacter sp.]|uniref:hypothetical protein n=1 Tax=Polaribacter sp. TaxID=1920175 RepID=UPI003BB0C4AE
MKNLVLLKNIILAFFISNLLLSCSDDQKIINNIPLVPNATTVGSGFFEFINNDKKLNIYYHIPQNAAKNASIVMVFHGAGRNAKDYRNAIIEKANAYNFIVITPEFSETNYPGGDGYNLGNVFIDGDNPSLNTINPENEWAFSGVENLFNFTKNEIGNTSKTYHIIGHSAGAQFAQRLIMFKPDNAYNKVIISAGGWYTVPNFTIDFPYGFEKSPLENINLTNLFSKSVFIQVGELDNNSNDSSLRRNQFTDAQGTNRFQRAYHFYNKSKDLAALNSIPYQWKIQTNKGLGHDFRAALEKAADIIFK